MSNSVRRKTKFKFIGVSVKIVVLLCASGAPIYANTNATIETHANINATIEDEFNYEFGSGFWTDARVWNVDEGEPHLKTFCATAHQLAGKGSYSVDWVQLRERTLQFKNSAYLSRGIDVVEYSLAEETTPWMDIIEFEKYKVAGEKWAITEGRQRDCVYYLNQIDNGTGTKRVFHLQEEVCGINNLPTPPGLFL